MAFLCLLQTPTMLIDANLKLLVWLMPEITSLEDRANVTSNFTLAFGGLATVH